MKTSEVLDGYAQDFVDLNEGLREFWRKLPDGATHEIVEAAIARVERAAWILREEAETLRRFHD